MSNPSNHLLSVRDVVKRFGEAEILRGASFSLVTGETVGLIGPNGSGKTTLFNCISGFHPPSTGEIWFLDENVTGRPVHYRARKGMGRVFQNFGIFLDMTLLENLLIAIEGRDRRLASLFSWTATARKQRDEALEFLAQVKLQDKANRKASSLSGGQRRLLEIIRTVAFKAQLLLLDEPTAGVAPAMKQELAILLQRLQTMGKTILVIEHDIEFIQSFCQRVLVLDSGIIALDGSPEVVRQDKRLQEIYFGKTPTPLNEDSSRKL